jgi:hypothetical protein
MLSFDEEIGKKIMEGFVVFNVSFTIIAEPKTKSPL